jgi:hypothetical protein
MISFEDLVSRISGAEIESLTFETGRTLEARPGAQRPLVRWNQEISEFP